MYEFTVSLSLFRGKEDELISIMSISLLLVYVLITTLCVVNGEISLMTFNVDLSATACPYDAVSKTHPSTCEFETRRKKLINEMINDKFFSDVVCLQGVWYERDAMAIANQLKKKYEYSYSFIHELSESGLHKATRYPPPCYTEDDIAGIDVLNLCNDHACYSDPSRHTLFKCIETSCNAKALMESMSESCLGCLFHGTVQDNFNECTETKYAFNPTGLLLLSKTPFEKKNRNFYHSATKVKQNGFTFYLSKELIQRGYLDVNIKSLGRVVCTQLSEYLGDTYIDLHPDFKSYEDKNAYEMRKLFDMLKDEEKAIILADMGATSQITKLDGNLGFRFSKAFNTYFGGWNDPISASYRYGEPHCTVCCGNKFVKREGICKKEDGIGYIVDHVLMKGFDVKDRQHLSPDIGRLFLGTPNVDPLSSHYGIRLIIKEEKENDNTKGDGNDNIENEDDDDDKK